MTTGATTLLGLALPVDGELDGTWGDVVNNAITEYTNIAIAGTLTLTGDGAVTLANTTGTDLATNITASSTLAGAGTATAQFAIVRVSSTTTTKVVTGPSYSKTYVVDNASSFAVTFKASGVAGVSIAAAEKCTVYYNGTDYVKVATSATTSGTVTSVAGTGTVNGITLTGTVTSSGSLTLGGTLANVDLTSQVTGTLPIANGGTGTTSTTFANLTTNVTGTLPVANGGTGTTSLSTNGVLLGNSTSPVQSVAPSTAGNVLTSNGTTWQSTAPASSGITAGKSITFALIFGL
jgi:hypothetical protein